MQRKLPCSVCKRRDQDKLMSGYWAWFPVQNVRSAYLVRYCRECASTVAVFLKSAMQSEQGDEDDNMTRCGDCGTVVREGDWRVTYLTLYIPKMESQRVEFWQCESDAISLRSHVIDYGTSLPSRDEYSPRAQTERNPWSALFEPA